MLLSTMGLMIARIMIRGRSKVRMKKASSLMELRLQPTPIRLQF
jgi:hypothetical protein